MGVDDGGVSNRGRVESFCHQERVQSSETSERHLTVGVVAK